MNNILEQEATNKRFKVPETYDTENLIFALNICNHIDIWNQKLTTAFKIHNDKFNQDRKKRNL